MKRISFHVEIGGRTKLGRAIEKMLRLGVSRATKENVAACLKAEEQAARELFRVALRKGWRPE